MGLDKAQMWRFIALRPLRVKSCSQIIEIERQAMRLVGARCPLDDLWKCRELLDELDLARIPQQGQIRVGHLRRFSGQMGKSVPHVAEHRARPRMRILNIEDW